MKASRKKINEDVALFNFEDFFKILSEPLKGVYATTVSIIRETIVLTSFWVTGRKDRKVLKKAKKDLYNSMLKLRSAKYHTLLGGRIVLMPKKVTEEQQRAYEEARKEVEQQLRIIDSQEIRDTLNRVLSISNDFKNMRNEHTNNINKVFENAYKEIGEVDIYSGDVDMTESGSIQFLTNPAAWVVMQVVRSSAYPKNRLSDINKFLKGSKRDIQKQKEESLKLAKYQYELAVIFLGEKKAKLALVESGYNLNESLLFEKEEKEEKEDSKLDKALKEINQHLLNSGFLDETLHIISEQVDLTIELINHLSDLLKQNLEKHYFVLDNQDNSVLLSQKFTKIPDSELQKLKDEIAKEFDTNSKVRDEFAKSEGGEVELENAKNAFVEKMINESIKKSLEELIVGAKEEVEFMESVALNSIVSCGLPIPGTPPWDSSLEPVKKWKSEFTKFVNNLRTYNMSDFK